MAYLMQAPFVAGSLREGCPEPNPSISVKFDKKVSVVALEPIITSDLWIDDARHLRMDTQAMSADCGDRASRC